MIKYGFIQPLTGGFLLGAQEAFGCLPQLIISYPGLEDANEKWWIEYYQKKGYKVPYFTWDRQMFDFDNKEISLVENKTYKNSTDLTEFKNLQKDLDVVVALPVCSALSLASGCFDEHNSGSTGVQNNNMKFITEYTLGTIKPKAFIFENAPALYTERGKGVRDILNGFASKFGYSVTYVKTNSNLHENVQYRERTFAIFWQDCSPNIGFYNNTCTNVIEFLKQIPINATHNDPIEDDCGKVMVKQSPLFEYMLSKFGKDYYREVLLTQAGPGSVGGYIVKHNLFEEALPYVENKKFKCPPSVETFKRWQEKTKNGQGFWDYSPVYYGNEKVCTVYFKAVGRLIHPVRDGGFTKREYMTFMGLPYDMDLPSTLTDFDHQIGQNCPVKTGRDWCLEIKKVLETWGSHPKELIVKFHNNTKLSEEKKQKGFQF